MIAICTNLELVAQKLLKEPAEVKHLIPKLVELALAEDVEHCSSYYEWIEGCYSCLHRGQSRMLVYVEGEADLPKAEQLVPKVLEVLADGRKDMKVWGMIKF